MSTSPSAAANWAERAAALKIDGRMLVDGERRATQSGETFAKHSPIDARLLGPIARGVAADVDIAVRSARAAFEDGRWAGQGAGAAQEDPAALLRADPGRQGRTRAARDAGHGQADPVFAGRRRAGLRALHRLVRRGGRQDLRRDRPHRRERARARHARAHGRDRRDRAVELPDDHGRLEAGPRAGRRQQRGAQAQREEPADRAAPGRARARGRPAAGRLQRRARLRPRGRRGAGAAHGGRRDRLHRLDARGPPHVRVRRQVQPEARLQRTGRQVGLRRVRRLRRRRARREDRRRRHVLQPGRVLQRALARAGARVASPTSSSPRSQREAPKYAPADPLDARTEMGALVDDTQLQHGAGLHRGRPRRRARASSAAAARRAPRPAATTSSRPCSTTSPTT